MKQESETAPVSFLKRMFQDYSSHTPPPLTREPLAKQTIILGNHTRIKVRKERNKF